MMLSACFCHLLADALPQTEKASSKFPLGPFLCALGYLLTLTADQYAARLSRKSSLHQHYHGNDFLDKNHVSSDALPETKQDAHITSGTLHRRPLTLNFSTVEVPLESRSGEIGEQRGNVTASDAEGSADGRRRRRVSFLTAMFLGLALSLHSILEGLALGAQQTIDASRDVLIAIAAHKGLAAYALGASLVDSGASTGGFWKVAGSFSIASPIGILVGYALSEVSSGTVAASLSALASGTFLYVATMEIIPTELEDAEHVVSKLLVMFFGFGAMSLLAVWA